MQSLFILTINECEKYSRDDITIKTKSFHSNMNVITIGEISLLCDGHIYNERELFKTLNIDPITQCPEFEIIIWLYKKYGITNTLQLLDGVFSFILVDNNVYNEHFKIIVARDIYGVKPLYFIKQLNDVITYSNNIHELKKFANENSIKNEEIVDFLPSSYTEFNLSSKVFSKWSIEKENHNFYYHKILHKRLNDSITYDINEFTNIIKSNLMISVKKMCDYLLNNGHHFGCILNENITSTILLMLICEYYNKLNIKNVNINTYCIGNENSDCIKYNRLVINNLKMQYSNICHKEFLLEREESTTTNLYELLFTKIKETDSVTHLFTDVGALECDCNNLMKNDENIIDYECNVKKSLENIHFKLSSINNIGNNYNMIIKYPFLDENFIEEYLNVSTQIKKYNKRLA